MKSKQRDVRTFVLKYRGNGNELMTVPTNSLYHKTHVRDYPRRRSNRIAWNAPDTHSALRAHTLHRHVYLSLVFRVYRKISSLLRIRVTTAIYCYTPGILSRANHRVLSNDVSCSHEPKTVIAQRPTESLDAHCQRKIYRRDSSIRSVCRFRNCFTLKNTEAYSPKIPINYNLPLLPWLSY